MTTAEAYREIAAQQRTLAAGHDIPQVREQLIAAAVRWEWLADEIEATQAGVLALFESVRHPARRSV